MTSDNSFQIITAAAFISTGLISSAPNIILFLFPNYSTHSNNAFLSAGQALAAGGLLGDVFLHTLPHAISDAKHEDENKIGLMVLLGFLTFLVFDMLVRSTGRDGDHAKKHSSHGHTNDLNESTSKQTAVFTSSVILNLAADALHNFTDGLAIGASYAASPSLHHPTQEKGSFVASILSVLQSRGGFASISVMLHEVPHELGDFAILLNAGFTKYQAIGAQFITSIAAFCGTGVGLLATHVHEADELLMPFTAGGFVYLAACCILPDLLELKVGFGKRVFQLIAFCFGIAIMYYVALWEHEEAHAHGHQHHDHAHEVHQHHDHDHEVHQHHDHDHEVHQHHEL